MYTLFYLGAVLHYICALLAVLSTWKAAADEARQLGTEAADEARQLGTEAADIAGNRNITDTMY